MKRIHISARLLRNGFEVIAGDTNYPQIYPESIWKKFPYKENLSQTAAVFFTNYLVFINNYELEYDFPPPAAESLFFKGLLFSLPETVIEFSEFRHQTSELIKIIFDKNQHIAFSGIPKKLILNPESNLKNSAVIPFTFGKDSLLTLGLIQEFKIRPYLFFAAEPFSPYENEIRRKIIPQFKKTTNFEVSYWPVTLGSLRQNGQEMWGWDMLQLQYSLLLLPYLSFYKSKYLFFSNEQNTNEYVTDPEGYKVNVYFEQSREWMLQANNLFRLFGITTDLGSLVEPIYELVVTYILYHRFPSLAQFQISCCGDSPKAKDNRWCGECFECGRMYLFLSAIGVDPQKAGFTKNLLNSTNRNLFEIFANFNNWEKGRAAFIEFYGEVILAFYLAYKRGAGGLYIDLFKKNFLKQAEEKKMWLLNRYLASFSGKTLPDELKEKTIRIYKEEIEHFRKQVRRVFSVHDGKY